MFCWKCGREINDSSKFCQFCGAETKPDLKKEDFETEQTDRFSENKKTGRSRKKLLAVLIIIAACAAAVLLAVHFILPELNPNRNSETASQTEEFSEDRSDENDKSGRNDTKEDGSKDPESSSDDSQQKNSDDKESGLDEDGSNDSSNSEYEDDESYMQAVRERFENVPEEKIEPFTEEELDIFEEADEGIDTVSADYIDEEGYIDPEECENFLDAVEDYVSGLKESGAVAGYERSDTSISVLFESGISYYIPAPIKGLLNSGDDTTRVLALETFSGSDYGVFDPDRNLSGKDLRAIAKKIDEDSNEYTFNESADYQEVEKVSVQYLKSLDSFKILLWHGHGGYLEKDGTILMTNQDYKKENHSLDTDMKLGRITIAHSFEWGPFRSPDKYAITSKFVDKYFPDIDDAIVYLGACDSCMSTDLADSFLRRGARCVIGYSKAVAGTYEMNCRAQLFERLRNGESIPDAVENTKNDQAGEALNNLAGGQLTAYYADDYDAKKQYLEPTDKKKEDENSNQPAELPDPEKLAPGQTITFGSYYRDYEYPNDKMPIEWEVLDVQDKGALIISKYALMNYPYLDYSGQCTWETSSLREWLNGSFYSEAFTENEKKIIGLTELTNEDNSQFNTDGGNDTEDYVFVLSAREAEEYFSNDEARRAGGTSWAYNNGLALVSPKTGDYSSVVFNGTYGFVEDYNSLYWLRTPGADGGAAAYVDEKGAIQLGGYWVYYTPKADPKVASNLPEVGVRPVLWLVSDTAEEEPKSESAYEPGVDDIAMAEAYREVLKSYVNSAADKPQYGFGFIDNDSIPELLISEGHYHAAGVEIYTCKDGAAVQMGVYGSNGEMSYIPYEDRIFTYWIGQGHYMNTYYRMDGSVIHSLHNTDDSVQTDAPRQVDDADVSEEEYDSFEKQISTAYPFEHMITAGQDMNMTDFSDDTGFDWLDGYLSDKARLKTVLEEVTGAEVYELICEDYDKDGKREAFAVTGDPEDNGDEALFYTNARVWFVSSDTQVTEMTAPEEGQRLRMISVENVLFYTFERHAYGSSSVSYIYGVHNGKPYEPGLSGKCEVFRRADPSDAEEEGTIVSGPFAYTKSEFVVGQGHTYHTYYCHFNSTAGEFENE